MQETVIPAETVIDALSADGWQRVDVVADMSLFAGIHLSEGEQHEVNVTLRITGVKETN